MDRKTNSCLPRRSRERGSFLTPQDRRQIDRRLSAMLALLEGGEGALMFDGEPLDSSTRRLLVSSLRRQLEVTKALAKEKFTPKKYRRMR